MTDFLPPGLRAVALTTVVCTGCSNRDINGLDDGELPTLAYECTIPEEDIYAGALRDAIPALTDPALVPTSDSRVAYLQNDDRVVSLDVNNLRLAVPLNVLWWHEIVNLTIGQDQLAVTHCPLTGSSLVFDRSPVGGAEFGVSGLLYQTNLVMYDRVSGESLWPQMERGARCGPASGTELEMVPAIEMRWDEFRQLYPNGLVVIGADDERSPDREYSHYPYGPDYRSRDNTTSIPDDFDARHLPKERVLGIPTASGGLAVPFGELEALGSAAALDLPEKNRVVFWDGEAEAAMAYSSILLGQRLTFQVSEAGVTDLETGSRWQIDGEAVEGPLQGSRLTPVSEAYIAYWFAWADFNPATEVWGSQS